MNFHDLLHFGVLDRNAGHHVGGMYQEDEEEEEFSDEFRKTMRAAVENLFERVPDAVNTYQHLAEKIETKDGFQEMFNVKPNRANMDEFKTALQRSQNTSDLSQNIAEFQREHMVRHQKAQQKGLGLDFDVQETFTPQKPAQERKIPNTPPVTAFDYPRRLSDQALHDIQRDVGAYHLKQQLGFDRKRRVTRDPTTPFGGMGMEGYVQQQAQRMGMEIDANRVVNKQQNALNRARGKNIQYKKTVGVAGYERTTDPRPAPRRRSQSDVVTPTREMTQPRASVQRPRGTTPRARITGWNVQSEFRQVGRQPKQQEQEPPASVQAPRSSLARMTTPAAGRTQLDPADIRKVEGRLRSVSEIETRDIPKDLTAEPKSIHERKRTLSRADLHDVNRRLDFEKKTIDDLKHNNEQLQIRLAREESQKLRQELAENVRQVGVHEKRATELEDLVDMYKRELDAIRLDKSQRRLTEVAAVTKEKEAMRTEFDRAKNILQDNVRDLTREVQSLKSQIGAGGTEEQLAHLRGLLMNSQNRLGEAEARLEEERQQHQMNLGEVRGRYESELHEVGVQRDQAQAEIARLSRDHQIRDRAAQEINFQLQSQLDAMNEQKLEDGFLNAQMLQGGAGGGQGPGRGGNESPRGRQGVARRTRLKEDESFESTDSSGVEPPPGPPRFPQTPDYPPPRRRGGGPRTRPGKGQGQGGPDEFPQQGQGGFGQGGFGYGGQGWSREQGDMGGRGAGAGAGGGSDEDRRPRAARDIDSMRQRRRKQRRKRARDKSDEESFSDAGSLAPRRRGKGKSGGMKKSAMMQQIQELLTARPKQISWGPPQFYPSRGPGGSGPVSTTVAMAPGSSGKAPAKPEAPVAKSQPAKIVQKVKQKVIVGGKDVSKKPKKGKRAKTKGLKAEYKSSRKQLMTEYRKFYKKIHRKLKAGDGKKEMLAKLRKIKKDFIKKYPAPSSVRVKQIEGLLSSLKEFKWTV